MTSDKTVLITGANGGLGLASTLKLSAKGYRVVGTVRSDDKAEVVHDAARLCLPVMRAQGWGRIIQISSLSARSSFPLMGWDQGSKQALEGLSDALRLEVAGDGISVVLIEPGVFRSALSEEFTAPQGSDDAATFG